MSEFKASASGLAVTALRTAGLLSGEFCGKPVHPATTFSAQSKDLHDKAFHHAIDKAMPNFRKCPKCTHRVCVTSCWNAQRSLCKDCAPDFVTELASAQAQTTVNQMRRKLQQQEMTNGLDLTTEAVALCSACGAQTHGAKFCPECGKSTRPANECGKCHAKFDDGTKFCPECGNKLM